MRILLRIRSVIYIIMYKLIYRSKFKFKKLILTGKSFTLEMMGKESNLIFLGKFYCRNNIYIVAENGKISIGDNVFFNNNVSICSMDQISIGNNTALGENVKIYDQDHIFNKLGDMYKQGYKTAPVTIGDNVWVGSNVTILKGVTIGDNSVIAAGSIVTKDVANDVVYMNKRETIVNKIIRES
ncbi:acyltransferase [Niallia alba]|uniref:Acyltransferase n=1 Tax=Niallia alba TaxID=2729105 RepID=A0A7Y0KDC2_9BACI|nr:acyltransferase [Niallia alba]NMO79575.1 acyltransferase [Niallia alba]